MSDFIDQSQFDWSLQGDFGADGPCDRTGCAQHHSVAVADSPTWNVPNISSHSDDWQTHFFTSYAQVNSAFHLPTDHVEQSNEDGLLLGGPFSGELDWMNDASTSLWEGVTSSADQLQLAVDVVVSTIGHSLDVLPNFPSACENQDIAYGVADNFEFVSGCRPLGGTPAQSTSGRDSEAANSSNLKCEWPDCSSTRTYKRKHELRRHMAKHLESGKYPCTSIHCPSKRSKVFYRLDKFREHLRNGHSQDDLFNCPVPTCSTPPLPLFALLIHARYHANSTKKEWHHPLEGFQEFDPSDSKRPCPFEGCRTWRPFTRLQRHLLSHKPGELMKQKAEIADAGYDIPSGDVICPICDLKTANHGMLAEHLELRHITVDGAHFAAWKRACQLVSGPKETLPWRKWSLWTIGQNDELLCPTCDFKIGLEGMTSVDVGHHLDLLVPPDQIRQYHQKILNLWPDFATHPVFNKILPGASNMRKAAVVSQGSD